MLLIYRQSIVIYLSSICLLHYLLSMTISIFEDPRMFAVASTTCTFVQTLMYTRTDALIVTLQRRVSIFESIFSFSTLCFLTGQQWQPKAANSLWSCWRYYTQDLLYLTLYARWVLSLRMSKPSLRGGVRVNAFLDSTKYHDIPEILFIYELKLLWGVPIYSLILLNNRNQVYRICWMYD